MIEEPARLVSMAEVEALCRELIAEVRELKARVAALEARPPSPQPALVPTYPPQPCPPWPWPQQPVWYGPSTGDPIPQPYRITCQAGEIQ